MRISSWKTQRAGIEDLQSLRPGPCLSRPCSTCSVCVPLVVTGILLNCFRLLQQGATAVFLRCPTKLQKTGGSIQGRLNVYLLEF